MRSSSLRSAVIRWAFGVVALGAGAGHAADRHHVLLIGISQYAPASEASPLLGVPKDMVTARRMALAMGVPAQRIAELRDANATKANILAALERLRREVGPGEKVFIYYSGHGTSFPSADGCQEGLLPYTPGRYALSDIITETELAAYTSRISEKSDKALVLIDACFSGGLGASRTRSLAGVTDIRPKFVARGGEACGVPVNQRLTRSFAPAMQRLGVPEQNFVQISAANYNEVSWDNDQLGGLATHSLGQCLLGDAKDLNRSGAITLDEIRQCAQVKLDALMAPHKSAGMLPSTIQVRGSRNLIVVPEPPKPVAVAVVTPPPPPPAPPQIPAVPPRPPAQPVVVAPAPPPPPPPTAPVAPSPNPPAPVTPVAPAAPAQPPAPTVVATAPPAPPAITAPPAAPPKPEAPPTTLATAPPVPPVAPPQPEAPPAPPETPAEQLAASASTLQDIHAQRNGRLSVEVTAPKRLTIGKDPFTFSVRANTDGYLYAVMLGSDGKSFYLLFPNKLDQDNKIKANVRYTFPRPGWSIKAGGPEGTNRVLFVVSPSARDPKIFAPDEASGGGAFTFSVAEMAARQRLVDFFVGRGVQGRDGRMASTLVEISEVRP